MEEAAGERSRARAVPRLGPRSKGLTSTSAGLQATALADRVRHAARRLLRADAARASPGADARRSARTGTSRSGRRPSPTSPCCACCARRGSAPTSPPPESSRSRGRPASAATRSSCTGTTRVRRSSRDAAAEGAAVVLDAPDEAELAAAAGVRRVLVRVTLGVDADTHEAIRTGHHGSKFGLPPAQARALVEDALARGLDVLGLHVHVGSQLADFDAQAETIVRLASFAASCRDALGWTPQVADLGGGFGIRHNLDEHVAGRRGRWRRRRPRRPGRRSPRQGLEPPELWLEPGRSLVGPAGVTLYRVGAVKRLPERTWVAVDGGMSDNPRPQLYDAVYTALSAAARADEPADERGQRRRDALRVGRRPDRRRRASPRRGAATSSRSRRPARTRSRWRRTTTASPGRRRCSSATASRAADPAARDGRRTCCGPRC